MAGKPLLRRKRQKDPVNTTPTKRTTPPTVKQRALVVGVSAYPPPISKLPAVAADVRGIAKLLSSRNGVFPSSAVTVLADAAATGKAVLAALRKTFSGAKADDTIFVYFAGHGGVEKGAYYYLAHDTAHDRLAETGIPLAEIKRLFDRTASKRVFVWLDCCHSGGILPRATTAKTDISVIKREIGVLQGEGKIIVAACTPEQSAYEDSTLGHGLFTHALLRGLKGEAKSAHGEVTASSLYDFIDREVKHPAQQPVFFGRMAGRIVLMHYPAAETGAAVPPKAGAGSSPPVRASTGKVGTSGRYMLLDGHVYATRAAREGNDGGWEVEIVAKNADEEAALRSLRGDGHGFRRGKPVSFSYGNQAFQAEVKEVSFSSANSASVWTISLRQGTEERGYMFDVTYGTVTPAQLAEMRGRLLLLGEMPGARDMRDDSMVRSALLNPLKELGIEGGVLGTLRGSWNGTSADYLRHARLWLAYYLKAGNVCDDILELSLGPERKGGIGVRFRGRRKSQYSGGDQQEILIEGTCAL
jgi:hypothetical protein